MGDLPSTAGYVDLALLAVERQLHGAGLVPQAAVYRTTELAPRSSDEVPIAIPCPDCGRQYDVTLFEFGRTIHCACGALVGREIRKRPLPEEPRFACDAMLGRTARWLRALGYDTAYEAGVEDADLVRRAVVERRIVLTKDRRIPEEWRIGGVIVLESEGPVETLHEIHRRVGLEWPRDLFTRCLECNVALEPAAEEQVEAKAPPRVRAEHDEFRRCPCCERIYWPGGHVRRLTRRLQEALGGVDPGLYGRQR